MTQSVPPGEVRSLGDRAFLIGVAGAAAGRVLAEALRTAVGDAAEVVGGMGTVMVHAAAADADLRPLREAADAVQERISRHRPGGQAGRPGRLVTVPCRFDGDDLPEVAALAGCDEDDVVALLTATPLTVAVIGFSPGFAYLEGLPDPLRAVSRRARPRPLVPAGSVAIANGQAAVYPTASPGGWQLVGRTAFPLFSPALPPYAVLAPGDRVQFRVAAADEQVEPEPAAMPPWSPPVDSRCLCEVIAPGLRAVVQDGGRRSVAAAGVPAAGPADPVSFALANRLTGNAPEAGALELTGGGTRLRILSPCHVAVAGGAPEVRVDGTVAPAGQLLPLAAGQELAIGRQHGGCRTYVAVAGGVLGPEWFGSVATDELTALGAGPLLRGDTLHAGPWSPPLGDHLGPGGITDVDVESVVELRVLAGPHPEEFDDTALARLAEAVFVVQPESNRVGIRLRAEAEVSLRAAGAGGGLDSQGMVTGAVQVPPDGDPVVLLTDHATLGGYPIVAVVASVDLGRLGQCAPGTRVRLVAITRAEADGARQAMYRELARAVVGTYPLAVD